VVVDAYSQLAAEGYLELRQGARPRVSEAAMPRENTATEPGLSPPVPRFDLRPRAPDVSSFPHGAWLSALRDAVASVADADLLYGDPGGVAAPRSARRSTSAGCAGWRRSKSSRTRYTWRAQEGPHGRTFCLGRGFAAKRRGSTVAHTDRPERQQAADRAMRHYRGDVHQLLRRSADRGARREPRSRMDAAASNPGAAYRAPGQRGNDYADRCGEGIGAGVAGRGATREPGAAPQCTRKARREVESRHPENAGTIDDQGSRRAREHRRT
jgi:hypothetical protein